MSTREQDLWARLRAAAANAGHSAVGAGAEVLGHSAQGAADGLASDAPRVLVADALDCSVGAVGRLRWMVRQPHHAPPR